MNDIQEQAVKAIEAQQAKVKERSPQWMVGEQLKDICRMEPRSAELIAQDLAVKGMGIVDAEKKIKAFADGHKTGNFACVTPVEADRILREFYGLGSRRLPDRSFARRANDDPLGEEPDPAAGGDVISLLDFL